MAKKIEKNVGYDSSWTGWDLIKAAISDKEIRDQVSCDALSELGSGTTWAQVIKRYAPTSAFEVINLIKYAQTVAVYYKEQDFESDFLRLSAIADETYLMMAWCPVSLLLNMSSYGQYIFFPVSCIIPAVTIETITQELSY